jgi:hypothetical protein
VRRGHHRRQITITINLGSTGVHLVAGSDRTVHLRLTRRARTLLANAAGKRLHVKATITLPGSPPTSAGLELIQTKQRHRHA